MSMTTALSNLFSLERQRARFRSDRLDHHDDEDDGHIPVSTTSSATTAPTSERPGSHSAVQSTTASVIPITPSRAQRTLRSRSLRRTGGAPFTSSTTTVVVPSDSLESPAGTPDRDVSTTTTTTTPTTTASSPSSTTSDENSDVESPRDNNSPGSSETVGMIPVVPVAATRHRNSTNSLTLAELEEERELARRRSSLCILLASFVLFRLWVSAIQEGDFGLMLLCLMGTSWTARWISYNREREEELDRRIAQYLEHGGNNAENGGDPTMERSELRMLSFQAQLALAIMESQRQMMQGGYGHPDGGDANPGVSEEARSRWTHFKFQPSEEGQSSATASNANKAGYGSVSQKDKDSSMENDGPHCSICLSEYEEGEDVVKLPCNHLYHDECILSWTSNHVKCPLCNYDLEAAAADPSSEIV